MPTGRFWGITDTLMLLGVLPAFGPTSSQVPPVVVLDVALKGRELLSVVVIATGRMVGEGPFTGTTKSIVAGLTLNNGVSATFSTTLTVDGVASAGVLPDWPVTLI